MRYPIAIEPGTDATAFGAANPGTPSVGLEGPGDVRPHRVGGIGPGEFLVRCPGGILLETESLDRVGF